MVTAATISSLIISLIIGYFVVYRPLIGRKPDPYFGSDEKNSYYAESVGILEMLKDLEADFLTGKVSRQDFDDLSLEYKRRYLELKTLE